jgi:hypothetical protein
MGAHYGQAMYNAAWGMALMLMTDLKVPNVGDVRLFCIALALYRRTTRLFSSRLSTADTFVGVVRRGILFVRCIFRANRMTRIMNDPSKLFGEGKWGSGIIS